MNAATATTAGRWILGLTGGIASGKSTVGALLAELGATVIDLDTVAREVVAPGSELLAEVCRRFGAALQQADGSLDRRALRRLAFANPDVRRELEALLHPAIARRTVELVAQADGDYPVVLNPLLAETAARERYSRVLVVDCPEELQRQRLTERDQSDPQEVAAMLAAQASRAQRLAIADDVLVNDGSRARLQAQVRQLHARYLGLARH
jgi:dephospho-CoA kinase